MVRLSTRLRHELISRRCEGVKQYQIARAAGLHPTVLSSLLHDILPLRERDPRVLAVGRVLGLSAEECFEPRPATERGKRR